MKPDSNISFNWLYYLVSYLLLLVPIFWVYYVFKDETNLGVAIRYLIVWTWGASAVGGILCALIGGGGLNKKPIDQTGSLAVILHLGAIVILFMLGSLMFAAIQHGGLIK